MIAAEGILTARGGVSSHAALVARQMGKVCVCGAGALHIDYDDQDRSRRRGQTFKEGDFLSIDGTLGTSMPASSRPPPSEIIQVLVDEIARRQEERELQACSATLMNWCSKVTRLQVRTNADTPEQTETRARVRRDGHRPDAHRTHVLRGQPH